MAIGWQGNYAGKHRPFKLLSEAGRFHLLASFGLTEVDLCRALNAKLHPARKRFREEGTLGRSLWRFLMAQENDRFQCPDGWVVPSVWQDAARRRAPAGLGRADTSRM